jgi:transposase
MLHALLDGEPTPDFARGNMRPKREPFVHVLTGPFQQHHRVLFAEHVNHLWELHDASDRLRVEIAERRHSSEDLLVRLETIAGVGRRLAELILADIGPERSWFSQASWAGMCPGNQERGASGSAAKHAKAVSGCALPWVKQRMQPLMGRSTLSAHSYPPAFRRGKKRAAVALGHTLLIRLSHVIAQTKASQSLGAGSLEQLERQGKEKRLVRPLETWGLEVALTPLASHPETVSATLLSFEQTLPSRSHF